MLLCLIFAAVRASDPLRNKGISSLSRYLLAVFGLAQHVTHDGAQTARGDALNLERFSGERAQSIHGSSSASDFRQIMVWKSDLGSLGNPLRFITW